MHIRTSANVYNGENGELLEFTLKNTAIEKTWQFETLENHRDIFAHWKNQSIDEETIRYEFKLQTTKSMQIHKGKVEVPPGDTVTIYCEFDKCEIADFDYVLHRDSEPKPVSWLLGSFTFSRTVSARGIGSGKLMAIYDNLDRRETREINYQLMDEKLLLVMNATNPTDEMYRLRITNSFLWAENFDLNETDLIEIVVRPKDIYKIEVVVIPSGQVQTSCRRL